MSEEWKVVEGSKYSISSLGNIMNNITGMLLNQNINPSGYAQVSLYLKGKSSTRRIHRLVAETFLGLVDGLEVNHKDGNKLNNTLINLEWCTRQENMLHAAVNNLMPSGEAHYNSKLNEREVAFIKGMINKGYGNEKISKTFKVSEHCIESIRIGVTWKHTIPKELSKEISVNSKQYTEKLKQESYRKEINSIEDLDDWIPKLLR